MKIPIASSATTATKPMTERGFNMMDDGHTFQSEESVLHMPVKLSKTVADRLNEQGRCDPYGSPFDPDILYIPPALAKSTDTVELIKHTVRIEHALNPRRLRDNLLLVTLRVAELEPNQRLGQGGWHVDGHQGAERIQPNGEKVAIDRIYCISNALPTQFTSLRLNLENVRKFTAKHHLTLDQINLQDIIEKTVQHAEKEANTQNETVLQKAGANRLFYANPYILHQSQTNLGSSPVRRSFLRLLYSVDERDRIGDTVNPLIGPCFPFKVKNIVDIIQLPQEVRVQYHRKDVKASSLGKPLPGNNLNDNVQNEQDSYEEPMSPFQLCQEADDFEIVKNTAEKVSPNMNKYQHPSTNDAECTPHSTLKNKHHGHFFRSCPHDHDHAHDHSIQSPSDTMDSDMTIELIGLVRDHKSFLASLAFNSRLSAGENAYQLYNGRKTVKQWLRGLRQRSLMTIAKHVYPITSSGFSDAHSAMDDRINVLYHGLVASVMIEKHNILSHQTSMPKHQGNPKDGSGCGKSEPGLRTLNDFIVKEYAKFTHFVDEISEARHAEKTLSIVSGNARTVQIATVEQPSLNDQGSPRQLRIVRYGDHVTRMQALANGESEIFHRFVVSDGIAADTSIQSPYETRNRFITVQSCCDDSEANEEILKRHHILSAQKSHLENVVYRHIASSDQRKQEVDADMGVMSQTLRGFDYRNLECKEYGFRAIEVFLPPTLSQLSLPLSSSHTASMLHTNVHLLDRSHNAQCILNP